MKDYEGKLVAKCYTKEGRLNRPRRSRSHCEKIARKKFSEAWGFRPVEDHNGEII